MKQKYTKTYKSYLSTKRRLNSEQMFKWLKELYCKVNGITYHD